MLEIESFSMILYYNSIIILIIHTYILSGGNERGERGGEK
jgi:hypothetical protein